jgi:hypothetical protein
VTRIVSLALAIATGLCAAVLVAWGPTVHFRGATTSCPGIIASAESHELPEPRSSQSGDPVSRGLGRACADKQRQWSVLAGLAAFVCLSAGSVAVLSRREEQEADEAEEEPVRTGP